MSEPAHDVRGIDPTALDAAIGPVLVAHAVEAVEVVFRREQPGWVLRITVEDPACADPGGGVTVDQLADVSRDLSAALDVADIVPHGYVLEVSSPGLERRLRGTDDYRRFRGAPAKFVLSRPTDDGQRVLRGRIVEAEGDRVVVEADGRRHAFAPADVARAHLVFEPPSHPKPGGSRRGRAPTRRTES